MSKETSPHAAPRVSAPAIRNAAAAVAAEARARSFGTRSLGKRVEPVGKCPVQYVAAEGHGGTYQREWLVLGVTVGVTVGVGVAVGVDRWRRSWGM